jgi:hypothetical protein
MLLLKLVLLLQISTVTSSGIEDRLWFLEQAMVRAQTQVREYGEIFDGAVILFHDRTSCPKGWEPASHLDNRFPLISHGDVGRLTNHTTEHPARILKSDCFHTVGVRAEGMIETCRQMPTSLNAKEDIPSVSLLACIKSLT